MIESLANMPFGWNHLSEKVRSRSDYTTSIEQDSIRRSHHSFAMTGKGITSRASLCSQQVIMPNEQQKREAP